MNRSDYTKFIESKQHYGKESGFEPTFLPEYLFDFQKFLVTWGIRKGRGANFADCGLGKTLMELVCAQNVVEHTNKRFLILTPLAVGAQTVREAEKFGIEAIQSREGTVGASKIIITNYEQLGKFNPNDFVGAACDESSILKNFDGKIKAAVTDFMRKLPYRFLFTATAAPNDYIELGTSSEALGELGYIDMLKTFFKSDNNTFAQGGRGGSGRRLAGRDALFGGKFRFRGHAERDFWRWVCSWARAMRMPSDLGFSDETFVLPPLELRGHVVSTRNANPDFLFEMPAVTLEEQRDERRRTISERCEMAAEIVNKEKNQSISWCFLNSEGDLLERLIKGSVQVSGDDTDEKKEQVIDAFQKGQIKTIISKPTIFGFGLNFQNCAHHTYFPSHSFEQWYQSVRRSWRFGQKNKVVVDMITSEGQSKELANLQRKQKAAEEMFKNLVGLMNNELEFKTKNPFTKKEKLPIWLSSTKQ